MTEINKFVTYINTKEIDLIKNLQKLNNESIDLIITSIPINICKNIDFIKDWSKQVNRILKKTGTMFINISDIYNKKGLELLPQKITLLLCENGWCLRNNIILSKKNPIHNAVKDRFCNIYENILFFIKDSDKYYNYEYFNKIDLLRSDIEHFIDKKKKEKWPLTIEVDDYERKWKFLVKYHNEDKTHKYEENQYNKNFNGISYSLVRKNDISKEESLKINNLIYEYYKKLNITLESIDKEFNYKCKSNHWIRTDNGRTLPKPEDWIKLKSLLKIKETKYDSLMIDTHYVLKNCKKNKKGKSPNDMWEYEYTKHKNNTNIKSIPIDICEKILKGFAPINGTILDTFCGYGNVGIACIKEKKKCILINNNIDEEEIILDNLNI